MSKRHIISVSVLCAFLVLCGFTANDPLPAAKADAIFLDGIGFEDDVDLVVAPDGAFLIIPEESEDGSTALVRIMDLDEATGEPLILRPPHPVPGFENGVDPMILKPDPGVLEYVVLIPVESEDGMEAGVLILLLDDEGVLLDQIPIDLEGLGFRDDVDGTSTVYPDHVVAFFALETEDQSEFGVLAIDADTRFPGFGTCTLLSTEDRTCCDENIRVDWLPGLVDGADPVAYKILDAARMVLPVSSWAGSDLLLIDFDPDNPPAPPPEFLRYFSVKERNETGVRPTDFPGYERDVDVTLIQAGNCGFEEKRLLVPVEGDNDDADLYLLDEDGYAQWVLSIDADPNGATIPGYEVGVDLVRMCGGGGDHPHRLAVPIENKDETDADLWILDIGSGLRLASVEDVNPGLPFPGYEIGVDVVRWSTTELVIPVEGPGSGAPGLIVVNQDGLVVDARFGEEVLGFIRSVDPIVDRETTPPVLYVPVGEDDGTDADVLIFPNPPLLAGSSIEEINADEVLAGFEWDVDIGLVDKLRPGGEVLYLPEEDPSGAPARVRFEEVPAQTRLVLATDGPSPPGPALYFIGDAPLGVVVLKETDPLGLETGLDMADGRGPVTPVNQPLGGTPAGLDADSDPTLVWIVETSNVESAVDRLSVQISFRNPFHPPEAIHYTLSRAGEVSIEIVDVAGRSIRRLAGGAHVEGEQIVSWDGLDDGHAPVPSGVYFLRVQLPGGTQASKILIVQ